MPNCVDCDDQSYLCATDECLCGLGCMECGIGPTGVPVGVNAVGERWLKAADDWNFPSRDARGFISPLISAAIRAMPAEHYFLVGTCWTNDGEECHGRNQDICDCWGAPGWCIDPCGDGSGCHECDHCQACPCPPSEVEGRMWDCQGGNWHFGFSGKLFNTRCRLCQETGEIVVSAKTNLLDGLWMRQYHEVRQGTCWSNAGVWCWGRRESPDCDGWCSTFAWECTNGECQHWFDGAHDGGWQIWNYLALSHGMSLLDDGHFTRHPSAQAHYDLKREAFNLFRARANSLGLDRVDRLDHDNHPEMDRWTRGWSAQRRRDLIEVYRFPRAYLRRSGCELDARLVISGAGVEVSLIPHVRFTWSGCSKCWCNEGAKMYKHVYPSVRIKVTLTLAVNAQFVGQCDGQSLETGPDWHTKVRGGTDDYLLFDDNGRRVLPPREAVWWGKKGQFSINPWADIWSEDAVEECMEDLGSGPRCECCVLARVLSGVGVSGEPDDMDGPLQHIYGGGMTITDVPNAHGQCGRF